MVLEQFRYRKFHKKNLILLEKIKEILIEYARQGIKVTLRQLYYQLVSRDIIPNKTSEYGKLSTLLTDGRYNGEIDWNAIEDRVRVPKIPMTFEDVEELIENAKNWYKLDRWEGQEYYVELWSEKDALSSVIAPITEKLQIPFIVNRGYSSASAMYEAKRRLLEQDKKKIILYLGDHDPSGLDMDRDIRDRLTEFGVDVEVIRIGLTQEQIKQYNPPTNPAKVTDPRSTEYIERYGDISWEVDALKPEVLQELIETNIKTYLDVKKYNEIVEQEEEEIKPIEEFAKKLGEEKEDETDNN